MHKKYLFIESPTMLYVKKLFFFIIASSFIITLQAASPNSRSPEESVGNETASPFSGEEYSPRNIETEGNFFKDFLQLYSKERWEKTDFETYFKSIKPHQKELHEKGFSILYHIDIQKQELMISIFNRNNSSPLQPTPGKNFTIIFKTDQNFKMWLSSLNLIYRF